MIVCITKRYTLHRCLQRHGISRLPEPQQTKPVRQKFKAYPPGYIHIDITQVYTKQTKLYLHVAIDRTTKYCIAKLYENQTIDSAVDFLRIIKQHYPCKLTKVLTDNGLQFTYHRSTVKQTHPFSSLCREYGIQHRLTKPYHPWTNGLVERMNKILKLATVDRYFYYDYDSLQKHLKLFLKAYNNAKHLRSLKGNSPFEQLCIFYQEHKQFYWFYLLDMSAGHYI